MRSVLEKLGIGDEAPGSFDGEWRGGGAVIEKFSPIDGKLLARVRTASKEDYERAITRAQEAFAKWRVTPAPVRGETVRQLGNALREAKADLGKLVTMEMGKIIAEGEGEVQ
ncbi:MAG: aldehyde dehydrogenase family protein, partial [Chthoniobacterales bacterium]